MYVLKRKVILAVYNSGTAKAEQLNLPPNFYNNIPRINKYYSALHPEEYWLL